MQTHHRVLGDPRLVQEAVNILARAQRSFIVSDSGMRHNLPIVTVISLNGGWTADS